MKGLMMGMLLGILYLITQATHPYVAVQINDQRYVVMDHAEKQQYDPYRYDVSPTITKERYTQVLCDNNSPACPEASTMYDILVSGDIQIDPAIELAQAQKETSFATAGVGTPDIKNPHGVQCHNGDGRVGDAPVSWGNGCAGVYASYADAVKAWKALIIREYLSEGRNTIDRVIEKYAPPSENETKQYIRQLKAYVDVIRHP